MKNNLFLMAIAAIALAFTMTVIGCKQPESADPALNGTWVYEYGGGSSSTYTFDNGSYEYENSTSSIIWSGTFYRGWGTYSTDDNKINWGGSTYEYNGAYYVAMRDYYVSLGYNYPVYYSDFEDRWYSSEEHEEIMGPYREPTTETYTSLGTTYEVSGNTLTLTYTSQKDSDGTVSTSSTTYTGR